MTEHFQPKYSILFNGELIAGTRRETALEKVAQLTNLDAEELLECLFSIKPVIINQTDEQSLAQRYLESFREAGLELIIAPYQPSHDEILNVALSFSHYAPIERHESAPNYVIDTGTMAPQETARATTASPRFRLIFDGELKAGMSKQLVLDNLCHLTKREEQEVVEQLFSVIPVIVLETSDQNLAEAYQADFESAGLSVRLEPGDEADDLLARSNLTIRNDAPAPPSTKKTSPFVYALLSLAAASILAWSVIYLFNQGYFDREPAQVVHIQLNKAASRPLVQESTSQQVAKEISEIPPPPVKPKPVPIARAATAERKIEKASRSKPKAVSPALTEQQLAQIKEDYFLTLLNWFAQPQHHGYDSETRRRNIAGDIKITITIDRQGRVNSVDVISSSSDELTRITRQSAYGASPYPPVPKEIQGSSYSFTLPLKYTLENQM